MKLLISIVSLTLFTTLSLSAQLAPDFTVTDVHGTQHTLYSDYLDQGKTVVLKFFFVACPPCNNIAPSVQQKYVDWGEGMHDVQFMDITTRTGDDASDVLGYEMLHSLSFPGIPNEGGADVARMPYTSGTFGSFFGTPVFVVIAPDRTVNYDVKFNDLDAAISATGATGGNSPVEPIYRVYLRNPDGSIHTDSRNSIVLKAANGIEYSLAKAGDYYEFSPTDINNSTDSFFKINSTAPIGDGLSAIDIFDMRKHILAKEAITNASVLLAADINNNGGISAIDLFELQKLVLGKITSFPNKDFLFLRWQNDLSENDFGFPGNQFSVSNNDPNIFEADLVIIRTGDINGQ